jgi:hypothetical protein
MVVGLYYEGERLRGVEVLSAIARQSAGLDGQRTTMGENNKGCSW